MNDYLVFDVDVNLLDFIEDPAIIFYGKDGTEKWGISFDIVGLDDEVGLVLFDIGETDKESLYLYIKEDNEEDMVGNVWCRLYGKIRYVDIGKRKFISPAVWKELLRLGLKWSAILRPSAI